MEIILNGQARGVAAATLAELIAELGLAGERVAVEHNRNLVPRRLWPETRLAAGDLVEVVQMVGGG